MIGQELFKNKESKAVEEFLRLNIKQIIYFKLSEKPIVAWGDGLLMGGALGVFNGLSHRVVTPNTVLSMPEVAIGFYPDVGAGYFLNKLHQDLGLFLGVTGARFKAEDALYLDFADYKIESSQKRKSFQNS